MTATLAKLARELNSAAGPLARALPALLFLTDQQRVPDPLAVAARLDPGSALILRHYGAPGRAELAAALSPLCRARGVRFLVAGDAALAAKVGAGGVHFPEVMAAQAGLWRRRRPDWLVTVAAHGRQGLVAAARAGAQAALLAPVFATVSPRGDRPLGATRFAALVRGAAALPLPIYALGGVTAATAPRLRRSGAAGLAAIAGVLAELGF